MSTSDRERFERFISKDCWAWTGAPSRMHAQFRVGKKKVQVHRYAYELYCGSIPSDMMVLHHCDNPLCVRPDHLYLGTQKDNVKDRTVRQRGARGEVNGNSKLTPEQVTAILHERRKGATTYALAAKYGVTRPLIGMIVNGKIWKHLNEGAAA